MDWQLPISVKR